MTLEEIIALFASLGVTVSQADDGSYTIAVAGESVPGLTFNELIGLAVDEFLPGIPWPPMTTDNVTGESSINIPQYRQVLNDLRGIAERSTAVEDASFKGFPTREEAERRAQELGPGFTATYHSASNTFRVEEAAQQQQRRSFDELVDDMFSEALRTGGNVPIDRILYLDNLRDQMNRREVTEIEAFNLAAPVAQNPQHLRELMDALLSENGRAVEPRQFERLVQQNAPQTIEGRVAAVDGQPRANGLQDALEAVRRGGTAVDVESILGPGRVPTEEEETGVAPDRASPEAIARVLEIAAMVERTGSFDPNQPAFGRFGRAGSIPGQRTQEEENWLQWFMDTRNQAAARGVGVPATAQQRFDVVSAKSPFVTPTQERPNSIFPTSGITGGTIGDTRPPLTAIPGTRFFNVPTSDGTRRGALEEIDIRKRNDLEQQLFKRRGTPRTLFR